MVRVWHWEEGRLLRRREAGREEEVRWLVCLRTREEHLRGSRPLLDMILKYRQ